MIVHTILFVADQAKSTAFYQELLQMEPILNVPGMTEFKFSESHILGLMPEKGIKRILGDSLPDPEKGNGTPRVELYIRIENPEMYFERAKKIGAKVMSEILPRPWGGKAGYVLDLDGNVIALAS